MENPANGQYTILNVYYNATPSTRSLTSPADFTQGQLVATFRSQAGVVNISGSGAFQASAGLTLDTSTAFVLSNGQTLNFSSLANALSLNLFGSAPSLDVIAAGIQANGNFSIPLAGTSYVSGT